MASNQCIIDDEYCTAMGEYFKKQGENLDKMVSDYVSALQTVRNKAIKKGEVADALDSFIDYAEKLKEQMGIISENAQAHVNKFLEQVDEADQYLF